MSKDKLGMMEEMLNLQNQMNSVVNPTWREANYNWKRAAWVECAELMDYIGFKWWKKQDSNLEQARIELVDIWHFMLSDAILNNLDAESLLYSMEEVNLDYYEGQDTRELIEDLVFYLLDELGGEDYFALFFLICQRVNLSFDSLYKYYVGKNVLNLFRQNNGYKEGTYNKSWQGKEDNYYLEIILGNEEETDIPFQEYVYNELVRYYGEFFPHLTN